MHWIKVTDSNSNKPVLLNLDHVVMVETGAGGIAIITMDDEEFVNAVETADHVVALISAHGMVS